MGYSIGISKSIGALTMMDSVVVNDLDELKAVLKAKYRATTVNFICQLTFSDEMNSNRRLCMQVDDLTAEDFSWLVTSKDYEVKYVEFRSQG
jgi:hypothetical protein